MPILAASCIGCSAERYAERVFMQMTLDVILQTCFGPQDRQNALFALRKINKITLPASHKHGKTAPNSIRISLLALHFILPIVLANIQTLLWKKRTLCCDKSLLYLEANLPISTLHHCTKSFEQTSGNVMSANR